MKMIVEWDDHCSRVFAYMAVQFDNRIQIERVKTNDLRRYSRRIDRSVASVILVFRPDNFAENPC
jgi:hypothetical protein